MICRNCGTEIAEKALICYRCGVATAEPRVKVRFPGRRPKSAVWSILALVVLVFAALFMARAALDEVPRTLGWAIISLGLIVVVWRLLAR